MISHEQVKYAARALLKTLLVCNTTAFARSSVASYTDVNGIVQTAQPNVLRNAHYVNGVLQPPLIEGAVTNVVLQSEAFDNAAYTSVGSPVVTPNTSVAPNGTLTADTLDDSSAVEIRGRRQTIAIANDALTRVASIHVLKTVGVPDHFPTLNLRLTGGSVIDAYVTVNTTTGATVTANGAGGAIDAGAYWRIWVSAANNSSGNATALVSFYPAGNTALSNALIAGAVGTNVFWGLDVEIGSVPTSYVSSGATPGQRAADIDQMLAAASQGYTRQLGSFVTEGFAVGMELTASGFARSANNGPRVITLVTPTLLLADGLSVEAAIAGRSLTVGLPSQREWENVGFTPTPGTTYVDEQYLPGPAPAQVTLGPNGEIELTPMYLPRFNVPAGKGDLAAVRYGDATLKLFAPRTAIPLPNGDVARVRADVAPFPGQLLPSKPGFEVMPITIPFRVRTNNSI